MQFPDPSLSQNQILSVRNPRSWEWPQRSSPPQFALREPGVRPEREKRKYPEMGQGGVDELVTESGPSQTRTPLLIPVLSGWGGVGGVLGGGSPEGTFFI